MNSRQLRYFCKVVEFGSITRAALALNIAQPALGTQIKQLEDDIGQPLLARHSRGVETTPAGRLLYVRAADILNRMEALQAELSNAEVTSHKVVPIAMSPWLTSLLAPALAAACHRAKRSLKIVEAVDAQIVAGLEGRLIAAALSLGHCGSENRAQTVAQVSFCVYRQGAVAKLGVLPTKGDPLRSAIEQSFAHYLAASAPSEATSPAGAMALAQAMGVAVALPVTPAVEANTGWVRLGQPDRIPLVLRLSSPSDPQVAEAETLIVEALSQPGIRAMLAG